MPVSWRGRRGWSKEYFIKILIFLLSDTKNKPKLLNELNDCRYVVPLELNMDRDSELCKEYGYQLRTTYYGDNFPSIETLHEYLLVS